VDSKTTSSNNSNPRGVGRGPVVPIPRLRFGNSAPRSENPTYELVRKLRPRTGPGPNEATQPSATREQIPPAIWSEYSTRDLVRNLHPRTGPKTPPGIWSENSTRDLVRKLRPRSGPKTPPANWSGNSTRDLVRKLRPRTGPETPPGNWSGNSTRELVRKLHPGTGPKTPPPGAGPKTSSPTPKSRKAIHQFQPFENTSAQSQNSTPRLRDRRRNIPSSFKERWSGNRSLGVYSSSGPGPSEARQPSATREQIPSPNRESPLHSHIAPHLPLPHVACVIGCWMLGVGCSSAISRNPYSTRPEQKSSPDLYWPGTRL
jgi:hypothetical protein